MASFGGKVYFFLNSQKSFVLHINLNFQLEAFIQLKQSLSDENKQQPKPILFSIILFSDFCFYHLVE